MRPSFDFRAIKLHTCVFVFLNVYDHYYDSSIIIRLIHAGFIIIDFNSKLIHYL